MNAAFLRKDVRISARAGGFLPGLPTLIFLQALAFAAGGAWAITVGIAPPPAFWTTAVTSIASISFFFAALGPMNAGAAGAMQEAVPEIAESLASAPVSPFELFVGKASLPAIQGIAMQLALLPLWGFLVGSGVVGIGAAFRVVGCCCAIVPVSAMVGVTRFAGGAGAGRFRSLGFRRTGQGAANGQQLWLLIAAVFWSSQVFHAVGVSSGLSGLWGHAVDAARPVLPMLLIAGGTRTPVFSLSVPSLLLTLPLLGMVAVSRAAAGVAASARSEPRDRLWAVRAIVAGRALAVAYFTATLWSASPQAACALAGAAALVMVIVGIPGLDRRAEAVHAARVPTLAGAFSTVFGGPAALGFWLIIAALAAALAAALPGRKLEGPQRRGLAVVFVTVVSIVVPLAAAWAAPLSPLLGPLTSLLGAFACLSFLAAPASLAHDFLGAVPFWDAFDASIPAMHVVRPWLAALVFYGAIATIAIWRGSRKKG